jgi:hypothetical protein
MIKRTADSFLLTLNLSTSNSQLEDIKSHSITDNRFLRPTLKLAEKIPIDAMAKEID